MPTLTKEQLKPLLQNAPEGFTPKDVLQRLVDRGYQIEGLNMPTQAIQEPTTTDTTAAQDLTKPAESDRQDVDFNTPKSLPEIALKTIAPGVAQGVEAVRETVGKSITQFAAHPVEFAKKAGSTLGQFAAERLPNIIRPFAPVVQKLMGQKPQELLSELQAPSELTPGGGTPFTSVKEAGISALKASETLSLPVLGIGKSIVTRVLSRAGIGGITGLREGIEKGKSGTDLIGPLLKDIGIAQAGGLIDEAYLGWKKIASLETQLNKLTKATPGTPIDSDEVVPYIDNLIGERYLSDPTNPLIKRFIEMRDAVATKGKITAKEALEWKRALYDEAYKAGKALNTEKAHFLQEEARGVKEALHKYVPGSGDIDKVYGAVIKTRDAITKVFLKGGLLPDVLLGGGGAVIKATGAEKGEKQQSALAGFLTTFLGRQLIGRTLLSALQQRAVEEGASTLQKTVSPLIQRAILETTTK